MDAQGSVVATTSSAQAQTGDMRYDAFGNKTYYVNTAGTFGWCQRRLKNPQLGAGENSPPV
jgi:hypothetical protein